MIKEQELKQFELEIKRLYSEGGIKAPVHLAGGNEDKLRRIFAKVGEKDWVFSTHRSHYHALLKGIDREWLRHEILKGHSISINSREHRFFSSAIIGGICPIAIGVAMEIKRRGGQEKVWVFVGDMAAETGIFHECVKYATGHDLPIFFVVEDNGFSVQTPTKKVWRYSYQRKFPHQGIGKHVIF